MMRAQRSLGLLLLLGVAACGGSTASNNASTGASNESTNTSSGAETTTDTADAGAGPRTRSGLAIHIQNVTAGGALPEGPDAEDRLEVSFELDLSHMGQQTLTGISITRARLLADDGREIVFGVSSDNWDGRLEAGAHRVVTFRKTAGTASPRPTRAYCAVPMRLELTLELSGRSATASSRRVTVQCAGATTPR